MSLPLKKIGRNELVEHLGKGGMGDVYKARQLPLERIVAVKILRQQGANDEEAAKRFEIEAKAIGSLEHHNIVTLHDFGFEDGYTYFVMLYVQGKDLFSIIKKNEELPFSLITEWSKQICRGLKYAHEHGVIHRDIKPHNILVNLEKKQCKISDFGIVQLFRRERITIEGMAIGTPEYMSPEQASGQPLDAQTDIYSFGILLYEFCTGRPPFMDTNPVTIAYKQVHEYPEPPSHYRKDIPKRLELIIMKCLKKKKSERYQSMGQILKDLDTVEVIGETGLYAVETTTSEAQKDERRITDRRQGDRRGLTVAMPFNSSTEPSFNLFSLTFWVYSLKQQWLSILFIIIAIAFFALSR